MTAEVYRGVEGYGINLQGCMTAEVGLTVSQSLVREVSSSLGMNEMCTGRCPVLVTTSLRD